jgi:hypothetical protein
MTMNNNIALKLNQVDFKFSEENPFFFYNVSVSFPAQKFILFAVRMELANQRCLKFFRGGWGRKKS